MGMHINTWPIEGGWGWSVGTWLFEGVAIRH